MNPKRFISPIASLVVFAGLAYGAYLWKGRETEKPADRYQTQAAERGDIVQTISANGTLNPVVLVSVGTQVSGTVSRLHADFNDRVAKGQVLAELDPALFEAQLGQDEASLASARADLGFALAKLDRTRTLVEKNFISKEALDTATHEVEAARARVRQAEAAIERDRTNLRYAIIRSPIAGVIVARNVDLGQTVAASFQTPTLFQIAGDLRNMQIDTSVAEADVGGLTVGQKTRFSVDAFLDASFEGRIRQIRLNPKVEQNVVTYNVVVGVDNADGRLLPGMTAHVQVTTGVKMGVLRVPNATLRFKPRSDEDEAPAKEKRKGKIVYRLDNGNPVAVPIKTGLADSKFTEVLEGPVKEGDPLIVRERSDKADKKGDGFRMRFN